MKKKHDKIVLLAKANLDTTEVNLTSIDSYISYEEFVLMNNVLRKYCETKEEIKNSKTSVEHAI